MKQELILASSSASRQMLMRNAGLTFLAIPADIDERALDEQLERDGASPEEVALELARAKALAVSRLYPGALVLGCDQTMALGARVYHKPKTMAEAESHLLSLSGKVHRLNSAAVLVQHGEVVWQIVSSAELTVRTLSAEFVSRHLQRVGEKALSSVGAYQLEGEGIQLFTSIEGDYFTILGLPLLPLLSKLRDMDVIDG
ncbi:MULTISPECIES: Maf-like protein [Agrobacterium]|jgi:septum formation protein|uniref:Nucleoside triphosphate pyrophosphatase n=1 Tax=Agrobacterium salinitolerans TaxID=1183413 RepID=A0ABY3BNT0_9HYPH|nr:MULTISPECIES: Maf-like protein [Agrobacterium]MCZ7851983.1 Maf-like protein [Agrobacterium salinitolerans]MCZ7859331.1 Maf-like protein [Agrobacterium salinitolerans]MCZ7889339.1 Maf-like protein [Agrobacterium salinitolerans]MCZ7891540.1 Maf-like protein [Agrobacterium salinitolerans]MCZ7975631.1 Maf-like protein [Agrobacterium salinitolerans]